ncbi:MAG TPA: hypothetical protein VIL20_01720 [Sandaracinaceae bacterium]
MRSFLDCLRFLTLVSFGVSALGCDDSRDPGEGGGAYVAIGYGVPFDRSTGCAVRADGTLACYAALSAIPTLNGRAVAFDPPCALLEGGRIACGDVDGELADPPLSLEGEGFVQIAVVDFGGMVCGRRDDGTVRCSDGISLGGGFRSIRGGGALCGVMETGEVRCGNPPSLEPIALSGPAIDAQGNPAGGCAILTSGELECWGGSPTLPAGPFVRVSYDPLPEGLGCAIREDGSGACFGPEAPAAAPSGRYADVVVARSGGWWLTTDGAVERITALTAPAPGRRFERINGRHVLREGVWECIGLGCDEPTLAQPYLDVASTADSWAPKRFGSASSEATGVWLRRDRS